jgi:hypothetical protein
VQEDVDDIATIANVAEDIWWMQSEVFNLMLWLINIKKDNNNHHLDKQDMEGVLQEKMLIGK